MPAISVILATYNDEKYIKKAIDSILKQTFDDFELIVIDDASTDNTNKKIKSIEDSRIILIENECNMGLPYSLNKGIEIAKGQYIARMDGDDISLPDRLFRQYDFMERNKKVAICGTNIKCFGKDNSVSNSKTKSDEIKTGLLFGSPLAHSTWFIRKSFLDNNSIKYNEKYRSSQDYELLFRIMDFTVFACVPEVLLLYRVRSDSISGRKKGVDKNTLKVQINVLKKVGVKFNKKDLYMFNKLKIWDLHGIFEHIKAYLLIERILRANKKSNVFNQEYLKEVIMAKFWGKKYRKVKCFFNKCKI